MSEIEKLARELAAKIAALDLKERIEALNLAREVLHRQASPFSGEPVDFVQWVSNSLVRGNDYNPNTVAPPEMRLLALSIETDGYTQPIVTHEVREGEVPVQEVVDGFHRHRVGREIPAVRDRVLGYLPVARIKADRTGKPDRIASTIRHNRARGEHAVDPMGDIVRMLSLAGWSDRQIENRLGMEVEEVLRLKQLTGLAALFADREFSEAWEPRPVDE